MRVFVSYTTKDPAVTKEKLEAVEARLRPLANVFIDLLHNEKGQQRKVNAELSRSDIVLQLVSPKHQSEWVQKELLEARKNSKPVVKVGIDELLEMDDEQLYLLLTDVDIKGWSVWSILLVAVLACVAISFLGIWLSYLYASSKVGDGDVMQTRGVFGDSWGGVNALISAFAFAGVIVTLFLQNRDLNLQRKEMARQREEFEKENDTLKYQRFENLFYNMLNLQQRIVDGLKVEYDVEEHASVPLPSGGQGSETRKGHRVLTGRDVFRYVFEEELFLYKTKDGKNEKTRGLRNILYREGLRSYGDFWAPTIFDHYFRHLYKILQFVDAQRIPFEEAYRYVSFLRGTLSRHELVWIYYNALQPQNYKLKTLIEKYTFLKNLRTELLTLTMETDRYYKGLGLTNELVLKKGFSFSDYEHYLTDETGDASRYNLSAFWKVSEIEEGKTFLYRWRSFLHNATDQVVEKI